MCFFFLLGEKNYGNSIFFTHCDNNCKDTAVTAASTALEYSFIRHSHSFNFFPFFPSSSSSEGLRKFRFNCFFQFCHWGWHFVFFSKTGKAVKKDAIHNSPRKKQRSFLSSNCFSSSSFPSKNTFD